MARPKVPQGAAEGGLRLWREVTEEFDLAEQELAVLREAVRTVDLLDQLHALVEADGLMSESSQGARIHPAVAEARQQKIALARLLAALRIPDEAGAGRTQHHSGVRGIYGVGA